MNRTSGAIVGCDLELKNGGICGVQAIGRCTTCERAFCVTHQAHKEYTYGWAPYIGLCVSCFAKTPEEMSRVLVEKQKAELEAAIDYFTTCSAQTALLTSSVQRVKIYSVSKKWKDTFFGRREVEVVTPYIHHHGSTEIEVHQAWIIGEFTWSYDIFYPPDGREHVTERCLTALPDLSAATDWTVKPLIRVRPHSKGYEYLESTQFYDWVKAAQAVKRLTGVSI